MPPKTKRQREPEPPPTFACLCCATSIEKSGHMCITCCHWVCDKCLDNAKTTSLCMGGNLHMYCFMPRQLNPDECLDGFNMHCPARLLAQIIAERLHMTKNASIKIQPHTVMLQILMCAHYVQFNAEGERGLWPISIPDLVTRLHSRYSDFYIPCEHEEFTVSVQIECNDYVQMWRGDPSKMENCSVEDARLAAIDIEKMLTAGDSCAAFIWVPNYHPCQAAVYKQELIQSPSEVGDFERMLHVGMLREIDLSAITATQEMRDVGADNEGLENTFDVAMDHGIPDKLKIDVLAGPQRSIWVNPKQLAGYQGIKLRIKFNDCSMAHTVTRLQDPVFLRQTVCDLLETNRGMQAQNRLYQTRIEELEKQLEEQRSVSPERPVSPEY